MITKNMLFNNYTLNIFTDASITKINKGETIGSAGSIVLFNHEILDEKIFILRDTTNNESEITAIRLGIEQALKFRNPNIKYINLFSDSMISIYGLREWIFSWVNNIKDEMIYNSSNKPVLNQSKFLEIIYMILNNKLMINLYHTRGHLNPNSEKDISKFINSFKQLNFIQNDIEKDLAIKLMLCNKEIDEITRNKFNNLGEVLSDNPIYETPIKYIYGNFNIEEYKKFIHY